MADHAGSLKPQAEVAAQALLDIKVAAAVRQINALAAGL
jgi:hypothetical protein